MVLARATYSKECMDAEATLGDPVSPLGKQGPHLASGLTLLAWQELQKGWMLPVASPLSPYSHSGRSGKNKNWASPDCCVSQSKFL